MQSSERSTRSRKIVSEQAASPGPESQSDTGQYMCIECSETFDTRLELNSHRQSHVIKKQFTCAHCGRGFHHQVFLQMHERSHEDGGSGAKTSTSRVISTRSSKIADVVHVRPTYTKPQRLLNSVVEFKNEQRVCQAVAPKEFLTRRSHDSASAVSQKRDGLEKKNLFELRISKFSDTTVHLMDSFGNSIEILADVFNTYTIGEPEKKSVSTTIDEALTKAYETSPTRNSSDDTSSGSLGEEPSVSPQTKLSERSQLAGEMDRDLPTSRESVTSESITSVKPNADDAGLPVPEQSNAESAAAPEQELKDNQLGHETVKTTSDKESLQPPSVPQLNVIHSKAVDSDTASNLPVSDDRMDTFPEGAAGPMSPQRLNNEPETLPNVDQAERSPTLITSTSEEPKGNTVSQERCLDENASIIAASEEQRSRRRDQSLSGDPSSLQGAAGGVPEINEDEKQEEGFAEEMIEQNQDLTLLKADAEVLPPHVDFPAERREGLPPALPGNVSALQGSVHQQSDICNTLSKPRDDVTLPTESESGERGSAKESRAQKEESTLTSPPSDQGPVGITVPEKRELPSVPINENAEKDIRVETDICTASQGEGEASISEGEVCPPERSKDSKKPSRPLASQDVLHDDELVIDDKREDLFEREIFPLETPMEVCEKGLASMEEDQNVVCGTQTNAKMVQRKESDICLNGSDMTYISESEMIKLLEQDKDEMAEDDPVAADHKVPCSPGRSQKDGDRTFSETKVEPELSIDATETKFSRTPASWKGETHTADGRMASELPANLDGGTAEVQNSPVKLHTTEHVGLTSKKHNLSDVPIFQATPKEKMDTDSHLPVNCLTNDEARARDGELQDPVESMLTEDLMLKNSLKEPGFAETSSSISFQPVTGKRNLQPERDFPCGDQNDEPCGSSKGNQDVNPVEDSTLSRAHDHVPPEENMDVLVTVEDNGCDDKVQQTDALESHSLKAVKESGHEKPHTDIPESKDLVCSVEPEQSKAVECVSDHVPSPQKDGSDPQSVPGLHSGTEKTTCNQERISKPRNAHVEMENPPLNDTQSTSDNGGQTNAADLKNEGVPDKKVEEDKEKEKGDPETDVCAQEQATDLGRLSKTLSSKENDLDSKLSRKGAEDEDGELPAAKRDLGGQEDDSIKKVEDEMENSTVASPKAVNDAYEVMKDDERTATKQISDVLSADQPSCQDSVQDALEDSELMENDHHEDADNPEAPSKPLGGGCLKCGRKIRRGRKEMVWLPVCFKCRKIANKKERLSHQEKAEDVDLTIEQLPSKRKESFSAENQDGDGLQQDISDESATVLDPLVAGDEKATLGSAAKKMYKCPKCDETFRIPALLAGHIKCHTLPQCLTCGCQMRLKYKTKRIPRRCQKCVQQLKEKMRAEKKIGEGSGDEDSGTSDEEDVDTSVADLNPEEMSDEDFPGAIRKAKRKISKVEKPGSCYPSRRIHEVSVSQSPKSRARKPLDDDDDDGDTFKKDKEMSEKQEIESSGELDTSDQNLDLPDGEKPRICPQCDKAFPCNRSLNLHLLSHTAIHCESCGCRLAKRRRLGRWSKKCRGCRLQMKGKLLNDSGDEMGTSSDKFLKQKNAASLRLKAKQTKSVKNTNLQSIIKKKKELKWMNMLLAVKGLMDKSRKKKEQALQAADSVKKDGGGPDTEKCEESSVDDTGIHPDHPKSDLLYPGVQKAGSSKLAGPSSKALSGTPKPGRKCLYKEKNIIKVEESEVLPYISTSDGSISTAFIKQEEMWQCLECTQSWPNSEALVNHQHSHISGQSFKCPQCPQVFSSEQYLNIHIHAHDEERPFRCPECDKTFTKRNHLGVHMRVHSGSRPFACPECPCRFRQKVTLIAHRYSHRNYQLLFTKPFQCSVCTKSFKQKERLVVHERLHTGECPFSCKDCDKVFPSKARLYVHRKMHKLSEASSGEQDLSSKDALEGQPFKCQDCGKACSTKASFVLHRKVHRLSSVPVQSIKCEENEEVHPFSCRDCNKVFSSKATLRMHLKNHSAHKATAKSQVSLDLKEFFPCKECDKVCSTKASLVLHRRVHKSTSDEQNLVIKVESETPSYICKDCNKVCSTKASLVLHSKVHKTPVVTDTETLPFRCKDCDMVCSTKASFVLHRKVHRSASSNQKSPKANTDPQLYSCKHCDMVCSTKASFVLHSKVHKSPSINEQNLKSDAEPQLYNCKHCDMVCSSKGSFVLHSKVHRSSVGMQSPKVVEETLAYNCKHCDTVCSTKASFILHSKVHRSLFGGEQSPKTPEELQSYNCKHCDMVCSTKAGFVLHSKVHRPSSVSEQSPKSAEEPQSYGCKECDMVCSTKASFVLHSKVHKSGQNLKADTEEMPFTCKDCNKVCSTKASFVLHRRVHKSSSPEQSLGSKADGAEPSFPCKDCGKTFSSKGRLGAHSKVHNDAFIPDPNAANEIDAEPPKKTSEEKPYCCSICGLRFIRLKMLVRHKAVHGERSVTPCIHCGKQFLYMKSLFNHIKICQSKSKGKKLLKKAKLKRKSPKDGGSTSSDGESAQKKSKLDDKPKAITAAQKLKNKNLAVKAKKVIVSKEKGKAKGGSDPKTKEKRAKVEGEAGSEGEGKKTEKQSDGRQEKPSEQTAKEPTTTKKSGADIKKAKKEPTKDKPQKAGGGGPKKWRMLAATTVKKKNLQAIVIGGKRKLLMKKKVQLKPKSGGKAGKD